MRHTWLFLSFLLACSGSATQTEVVEPQKGRAADEPAPDEPEEASLTPEEVFERQKHTTCEAMCTRITDCAVEDAKAKLTDEQLEELDLVRTAPKNIEECSAECGAQALSPRQVQVIRDCLGEESECSVFMTCLEKAAKSG